MDWGDGLLLLAGAAVISAAKKYGATWSLVTGLGIVITIAAASSWGVRVERARCPARASIEAPAPPARAADRFASLGERP